MWDKREWKRTEVKRREGKREKCTFYCTKSCKNDLFRSGNFSFPSVFALFLLYCLISESIFLASPFIFHSLLHFLSVSSFRERERESDRTQPKSLIIFTFSCSIQSQELHFSVEEVALRRSGWTDWCNFESNVQVVAPFNFLIFTAMTGLMDCHPLFLASSLFNSFHSSFHRRQNFKVNSHAMTVVECLGRHQRNTFVSSNSMYRDRSEGVLQVLSVCLTDTDSLPVYE